MLSGQITAGDMLTRIQNHKITPYGYNLTEVFACESIIARPLKDTQTRIL